MLLFLNCSKYNVDGIGSIFLGMYILGRGVQAGPAKTLKTSQYRCAALIYSSSDLKFWHVIWTKLAKTVLLGELKKNYQKNPLTFHQFHDFGKLLAGHMSAIFFFFLSSPSKYCFGELRPHHVSKFQVLTLKIEVHGQAFTEGPLHTKLHIFQGFIHNFRTKVTHEMKRICPYYSSSRDVHAQKNWPNSIQAVFRAILEKATQKSHEKNAQTT